MKTKTVSREIVFSIRVLVEASLDVRLQNCFKSGVFEACLD